MRLDSRSALLLILVPGLGHAATWTVSTDGSSDFASIQDAIDRASSGDLIQVEAGTYAEGIDFSGKDLSVVSTSGSASTAILPSSDTHAVRFTSGETSAARLEGFTIVNTGQIGLYVDGSSPTLVDLIIGGCGSAATWGSGATIHEGSPSFTDCTFEGNQGGSAPHVYVSGSAVDPEPTFTGVEFSHGSTSGVGAVYLTRGTATFTECSFADNTAGSSGGALYVASGVDVTLVDTVFTGNSVTYGNGGAAYVDSCLITPCASLVVEGGVWEGNTATNASGGALYVDRFTELSLTGVSFIGNEAYRGAAIAGSQATVNSESNTFADNQAVRGAVSLWSSVLIDTDSTFEDNEASDQGGAIWASDGADLTLGATAFLRNSASIGGAVYGTANSALTVEGGEFVDNTAASGGGAVALYDESGLYDTDSVFTGNTCHEGRGGAIQSQQSYQPVQLTDTTLTGNESMGGDGGAVYAYYAEVKLDGVVLEANLASDSGGGVYHEAASLWVLGSTLVDNVAEGGSGGAVAWDHYEDVGVDYWVQIEGNTVEGNSATSRGGGLSLDGPGTLWFTDNLVQANEAGSLVGNGGGLFLLAPGEVQLRRNTFCSNKGVIGGGVAASGHTGEVGPDEWTNNVFYDNEAGGMGGAIHLYDHPQLRLVNNDFLANRAHATTGGQGGALYASQSFGSGELVNNIIAGHPNDVAVWVDAVTATALSSSTRYNDWWDNPLGDVGGSLDADVLEDGTNLFAEPRFVDYRGACEADQLALAHDSALRDRGDPALWDPNGTRSDIGAYGGPEALVSDADADGWPIGEDCDDDDPARNPGAREVWDGVDNDCDDEVDPDTDEDGILDPSEDAWGSDPEDDDSDDDGIPDAVEWGEDPDADPIHSDTDGLPDVVDTDSDDDGRPDADEGVGDTDADGLPDYRDDDDDGDGLSTASEAEGDQDGDGLDNNLDPDADGDGALDGAEGTGDSDGDGLPDYLDDGRDGAGEVPGEHPYGFGCAVAPGGAGLAGLVVVLLGLARRRRRG